jgi:RHS repeat-associated protein
VRRYAVGAPASAVCGVGVAKYRLFDGTDVVAEGNTQVVRDPSGSVQSEVVTWWDGWQQWGHWATTRQDVLKDALGSPVGVAVDGVVSKDLQVFGDFGDVVHAAAWDTVTGFTGQAVTDGLTEFATRTYDAASKVWLQDDTYRGTTTRSASLNRYAYVEGAPESFVDVLGFYRARAAIQAQKLAAVEAANQAAAKARAQATPTCSGYDCYLQWQQKQAMNAKYAEMYGPPAPGRLSASQLYMNGVYAATYGPRAPGTLSASELFEAGKKEAAPAKKSLWDRAVGAVANTVASVVTSQAGGSQCSSAAGAAYWVFSAGVSCDASQAQYYDVDPLGDLSVAAHGLVNFGGGVVNGASGLVNGITGAVNWANNTCASVHVCVDIPDIAAIPAVPIWGDYDQYRWSSYIGSGTFQAVAVVGSGGIGAGGLSADAGTALLNVSGITLAKAGVAKISSLLSLGKTGTEAVTTIAAESTSVVAKADNLAEAATAKPMLQIEAPPTRLQIEAPPAAANSRPDFIASADGVVVPTSRSQLVGGFEDAGLPSVPTRAPGTQYTLPDGNLVRVMEPSGQAPLRASFTDALGNLINPFTGGMPQPPPGVSGAAWRQMMRDLTHVELGP